MLSGALHMKGLGGLLALDKPDARIGFELGATWQGGSRSKVVEHVWTEV